MPGKNKHPLRDEQWKPHPNSNVRSLSIEQDNAAGGHENRAVRDTDGAIGRVILRRRYWRVYAELRWQVGTKRHTAYLCQVKEASRAANLAFAWARARAKGLIADAKVRSD